MRRAQRPAHVSYGELLRLLLVTALRRGRLADLHLVRAPPEQDALLDGQPLTVRNNRPVSSPGSLGTVYPVSSRISSKWSRTSSIDKAGLK